MTRSVFDIALPARLIRPVRAGGRSAWFALAAALVVLGATVVAWALAQAADRTAVVGVVRPVAAGEVLAPEHLTVRQVAVDGGATGLVPAAAIGELVGRRAAIDLEAGVLMSTGMWSGSTELGPDERSVGMMLRSGRAPAGLAPERAALIVDLTAEHAPILVRVLAVDSRAVGTRAVDTMAQRDVSVTVAVPAEAAETVAVLAAADAVAVIGIPSGSEPGEAP